MIIVSGTIRLHAGQRDAFLDASTEAMILARQASGCRAFFVVADPIEPDVANVYEEWDNEQSMLSFRGDGPPTDMRGMIAGATVQRHHVSRTELA